MNKYLKATLQHAQRYWIGDWCQLESMGDMSRFDHQLRKVSLVEDLFQWRECLSMRMPALERSLHMGSYGQVLLYTNVHTEREITSKYNLNHTLLFHCEILKRNIFEFHVELIFSSHSSLYVEKKVSSQSISKFEDGSTQRTCIFMITSKEIDLQHQRL